MEAGMIQKIGQVAVPVKDLEQAVEFYENVLELPLLFNTGTLAFFDCGGIRLLLSLPKKRSLPIRAPSCIFRWQRFTRHLRN